MMEHDGMPMIAGIAAIMRWLEELIVVLSAPLLIFGMGITLVDLLTDGAATLAVPWLLFAWAISQALGIEANISGAAYKGKLAYERGAWGALVFYVTLVLALCVVAVIAGYAYAFHQSQGVPITETLRDLGIDAASWTMARAILAVGLVVVSALLRFTGKKESAQSKLAKLQEELALAPLKTALRVQQAQGARAVVAAARGKGAPAPTTQPAQPADPYAPNSTPWGLSPYGESMAPPAGYTEQAQPSIHLVPDSTRTPPRRRKSGRKPRGSANWEAVAREAWEQGARTVGQMESRVMGMSHTAAQYWVGVFKGEERGAEQARKEA